MATVQVCSQTTFKGRDCPMLVGYEIQRVGGLLASRHWTVESERSIAGSCKYLQARLWTFFWKEHGNSDAHDIPMKAKWMLSQLLCVFNMQMQGGLRDRPSLTPSSYATREAVLVAATRLGWQMPTRPRRKWLLVWPYPASYRNWGICMHSKHQLVIPSA